MLNLGRRQLPGVQQMVPGAVTPDPGVQPDASTTAPAGGYGASTQPTSAVPRRSPAQPQAPITDPTQPVGAIPRNPALPSGPITQNPPDAGMPPNGTNQPPPTNQPGPVASKQGPGTSTGGIQPPPGGWYGMAGFDTTKLTDPNHPSYNDPKYTLGHLMETVNWGRGNLQPLVDALNAAGLPASVVPGSDDTIKFGDSLLDLVNSGGYYQYLDVTNPSSGGGGAPAAPAAGGGAPAGGGGNHGGGIDQNLLAQLIANLPQGPGVFDATNVQQVGQDPFSQLITDKLGTLIANNGYVGPNMEATNLENARQAADRARRAEYSGVLSELANRGLLPEGTPGGQGGLALDSLARIERNDIAPLMSNAVRDYMINGANNANTDLMGALQQAETRQTDLSNIALQTLAQNTAFNEFLATFGLQRDQVLYELASGQNQNLVLLLTQFLKAAGQSAQGFIGA